MTGKRNHTQTIQNRCYRHGGATLIELVVVILILAIVCVGTINYQYFGTRMALRADAEITAARTARLILDNWKKSGGSENFDLEDLNTGFTATQSGSTYEAVINDLPLTVELRWTDVAVDVLAGVGLRQLEITVRWRQDYQAGELRETDPTYIMTTYVRREESEG